MNLNRKYEEAVSAVIGVVLMVAIVMAIAAVAYAQFSGLIGGEEDTVPTMQLIRDEQADRLIVNNAEQDADWSRLYIYIKEDTGGTTIRFAFNADAGGGSTSVGVGANAAVQVLTTATQMNAGSYLDFAADPAAIQEVTIVVRDGPANAIIGEYIFQEIGSV